MSYKYTDKSIIGGPISQDVLNLINKRQEVFGQTSNFSDQQLMYFNANTGWVKMTSSVNVRSKETQNEDKVNIKIPNFITGGVTSAEAPNVGDSELAKKYVLLGGALKDQAIRTGLVPDTDDIRSAYELDETFGYVPMPGIDGFQVQHEGTFGTLRVATVEFKANSIQQLTELEQLFLRPGFTLLLEWGHSIYLDVDGNVQTQIQTIGDEYFNMYKQEQITEKIKELRTASNYNYEAMYGFIKNFTWKYSQNGEYDCQAFIISSGEIVESLQLAIFGDDKDEESITTVKENATPLHSYMYAVKSLNEGSTAAPFNSDVDMLLANEKYKKILEPTKKLLEDNNRKMNIFSVRVNKNEDNITEDQYFRYIPLSNLLAFLNVNYMIKSEGGPLVSFYLNDDPVVNNFTTFAQHFIIDPYTGFLPKGKGTQSQLRMKFAEVGSELNGSTDDILNICVNVDFILEILDQKLNSNVESSKTVHDLVKEILDKLSSDGGKINDFDLHYDDETFQFHVVDRSVTPSFTDISDSLIDVIGLNTQVEDVSLSSKIPSSITAMVAVAAQNASSDVGEELLQMQKWNQGLVDRTQFTKNIKGTPEKEDNSSDIKVLRVVNLLNKLHINDKEIYYNQDDFTSISAAHISTMKRFLQVYTSRGGTNIPGLIPLELQLKLQGTAGLKIGEAFNISPTILPQRYRGTSSFLTTGVTNFVEENKWNTEITAQMIVSGKFEYEGAKPEGIDDPLEVEQSILEDIQDQIEGNIPEEERVTLRFPLASNAGVRNDEAGGGDYGDKRDSSVRNLLGRHRGVDYAARPGLAVIAPLDGNITRTGKNFSKGLPAIEIQGTGRYEKYYVKIAYAKTNLDVGDSVKQGFTIGSVVSLSGETNPYGPGYDDAKEGKMNNHIHVELLFDGKRVNPTKEFSGVLG